VVASWQPLVVCTTCRPVERPLDGAEPSPPIEEGRSLIDAGVAGGSTLREHERRHGNRERQIRTRWGRLAGLVLALSEDPLSTRVWERGSVGESKLGAALGKIDRDDVIFLHDRAVPGSRRNIDHIVVAPSGVYVVDAKRYRGRVEVRDVSGLFSRADLRLFVGGRDRSKLAHAMDWQVEAVRAGMGGREDVPITPVLCFIDAEWPLFGALDLFEEGCAHGWTEVGPQARNPTGSTDGGSGGRGRNRPVPSLPGLPARSAFLWGARPLGKPEDASRGGASKPLGRRGVSRQRETPDSARRGTRHLGAGPRDGER
jgi:hypothetical protein